MTNRPSSVERLIERYQITLETTVEGTMAPTAAMLERFLEDLRTLPTGDVAMSVAREPDRLLTPAEVAELLGTSVRWVYDHQTQLGGRRLSRRCLRFPEAAVRRYLERRR
jgi:excisionase family DNA binding protein